MAAERLGDETKGELPIIDLDAAAPKDWHTNDVKGVIVFGHTLGLDASAPDGWELPADRYFAVPYDEKEWEAIQFRLGEQHEYYRGVMVLADMLWGDVLDVPGELEGTPNWTCEWIRARTGAEQLPEEMAKLLWRYHCQRDTTD